MRQSLAVKNATSHTHTRTYIHKKSFIQLYETLSLRNSMHTKDTISNKYKKNIMTRLKTLVGLFFVCVVKGFYKTIKFYVYVTDVKKSLYF